MRSNAGADAQWAAQVDFGELIAEEAVDRNPLRQVLVRPQQAPIVTDERGQCWAVVGRERCRVYQPGERYAGWDRALRTATRLGRSSAPVAAAWLGERTLSEPARVVTSFDGVFSFVIEDRGAGRSGLRRPQLGALHSVLGYWTTARTEPATVVMPTGTGKTDTMIALLVALPVPRLLVLVPSDALREQLARKFETLGVLHMLGTLAPSAQHPVVGQIRHRFTSAIAAGDFARRCNVIVATPAALTTSPPDVQAAVVDACSHLFVDEAHHVAARTWKAVRESIAPKPVVQFTATPFREDGRQLGGRLLYAFPLREAQRDGYFAPINYVSVVNFTAPDRAVAQRAVDQLRVDLAAGHDHLLMARVRSKRRADELLPLYQELAADLMPVVLHSSVPSRDRRAARAALDRRESRIVVCVDMLGEGFDLPSLKIAAVHDAHKSLGVTLQFVGRFTRAGDGDLGPATAVVSRPERAYDPSLRQLYAEDADWNLVIRDLSEMRVQDQQETSDFEAAFAAHPEVVSLRNLAPKMSTVVYRTRLDEWSPESVIDIFPEDWLLTYPIPVNQRDRVAWFVTKEVFPVRWGDLQTVEEISYHLYVLYWDERRQLLYINSSNTDSVYPDLAKAVCGESATRITGEAVYRAMAQLARLVPTNVGVLDVRNRSRRFSMHVGADVSEGFPVAEAQTKTKTNIFATGYHEGIRVTIGVALKGRIWSQRAASSLWQWVDWCDGVGSKVTDDGISVDEVMRGFIRPTVVERRPPVVPIALEWPWQLYALVTEDLRLSKGGRTWPLIDVELNIVEHCDEGPIPFELATPTWSARYTLDVRDGAMVYGTTGEELAVVNRRERATLTAFLQRFGLTVIFSDDVTLVPPGILLRPERDLAPFDSAAIRTLDWVADGVDIRRESQGATRDATSVQARMVRLLRDSQDWEVILDDDGPGELADIVAFRVDGDDLVVSLTHCKYSSEANPGARISDLYEVCGQAQKSARWKRDTTRLFEHLIRRERHRHERLGRSGLELGVPEALFDLEDRARLLRTRFEITVVQPGLSRRAASTQQLELLACTELYVRETANASLEVFGSE